MECRILPLKPGVVLPAYETAQAAAMDIRAHIEEPLILRPHERAVIPTGFAIELPEGFEAQIRARSGLAAKHGIAMANGVGTIDADYRGEVGVILINLSTESFTVDPGMRIAQLVIAPVSQVVWKVVPELDETARGSGGYGSTGRQ